MSRTDYCTYSEDDGHVSPYIPWGTRQGTSRVDPGFPVERPQPSKTVAEGIQVWEPPEIDCEDLMGDEYEKKKAKDNIGVFR